MTTRAPNSAPTPEVRIAMREAEHLGQSRRSRSLDHKAAVAARRADERRRELLEQLKDQAAARRSFRKFKNTVLRDMHLWKPLRVRVAERIPARPRSKKGQDSRPFRSLPSIGFDVLDSKGRRGIFLSIHYDGAKSTTRGVFRRRIEYALNSRDVVLAPDGRPLLVSNVAADPDEAVALADEIEAFARAERLNGKVCFNVVIGYPRGAGARQRELILRRFCQRAFADEGVPFFAINHAPKRGGQVHNPHGHIAASLRPVHREGAYQYLISKDLRVDLDGEDGMGRMRRILAEVTTQVMREAGFDHQYTHLSNATRGIAVVPQEGLSKEQSEAAKRGEHVAANERNKALVREARAYLLEQRKRGVEASKAPLLTRLPWSVTRVPHLAKAGLTTITPARIRKVLGLAPRGEIIRIDLLVSAPAAPTVARPIRAEAVVQQPLTGRTRPRLVSPVTPPNTAFAKARMIAGLPQCSNLPALMRSVDDTVKATALLVGVAAPSPVTAGLTEQAARPGRARLVMTNSAPKLPASRFAAKPPVATEASLLTRSLAAERASFLSPVLSAIAPALKTRVSRIQLPESARIITGVMLPAGPASSIGSASQEDHPTLQAASSVALFGNMKVRRLAVPTRSDVRELTARVPRIRSIPLISLPNLGRARTIHAISVQERFSPQKLLRAAWTVAPVTKLRLVSLQAASRVALPSPSGLQATSGKAEQLAAIRTVGVPGPAAPQLINLPKPDWSTGEFDWLRAKVQALRAELAAVPQLEPFRMSPVMEKTAEPQSKTAPTATPSVSPIEQLQNAFRLAKNDEERRRAAIAIRKNKAALAAMNAEAHPLWTKEQSRFLEQQRGAAAGQWIGR